MFDMYTVSVQAVRFIFHLEKLSTWLGRHPFNFINSVANSIHWKTLLIKDTTILESFSYLLKMIFTWDISEICVILTGGSVLLLSIGLLLMLDPSQ